MLFFPYRMNSILLLTAGPPWPRGQGGRPALRIVSPALARENGQRGGVPEKGIDSVQRINVLALEMKEQ